MKKLGLLLIAVISLSLHGKAQVFSAAINGQAYLCPGTTGQSYLASKSFSGNAWGFSSLVWHINHGQFKPNPNNSVATISPDGHTYTVPADKGAFTDPESTAIIDWDNVNNTTDQISAVYYYGPGLSVTGTLNVNIGIIGSPSVWNGAPISICSTPNPAGYTMNVISTLAGTDATNYIWTTNSGYFSNATTGSGVLHPAAGTGPITITIRFQNTNCHIYSTGGIVYTIPRCAAAPVGYASFTTSGARTCTSTFYLHPSSDGTVAEVSYDNGVTWTIPYIIYLEQGTSLSILMRSSNDCGFGPVKSFRLVAPAVPTCPKRYITVTEPETISEVSVSPNPASHNLNIAVPETDQLVEVSIFDMTGQLVQKQELAGGIKTAIDIEMLPAGMYAVQVLSKDGQTINSMKKIMVTK